VPQYSPDGSKIVFHLEPHWVLRSVGFRQRRFRCNSAYFASRWHDGQPPLVP
jgi:hypothetical protein